MKKLAIFIATFFSLLCPVLCQEMPNDVPPDHYAYDAIADLVDRGINVSQGYPDGTFRGSKKTSRYENAYFMASLALNLRRTASVEIDFSDIEEEISYLRNDITSVQEHPGVKGAMDYYGSVELKSKFGSVLAYNQDHRAPLGPETNYRLKYTIAKELGDDANIKLNLDTMDGAYNSPTLRPFATKLIDFEGNLSADLGLANPVKIKALFGPGSVEHIDTSGVAPSEDHTYYSRPRPSFIVGTEMGDNDITGAYVARGVAGDGSVGTSEIYLQIGRKLGKFPLLGSVEAISTSRYVCVDFMDPTSMPNDFKQELSLLMTQGKELSEKILVGASSTDHPKSQFYLNFELYLKNLYGRGINLNFLFNSVGMDYRLPFEELEFTPLNLFSRKILDGTVDVGLEITVPLSSNLMLKSKSELVTDNFGKIDRNVPGSSYTQELSLDYLINRDFTFKSFYRYYFVPSKIAQFSLAVPEMSDLVGLSLVYRF
jgi:hypothetical protein